MTGEETLALLGPNHHVCEGRIELRQDAKSPGNALHQLCARVDALFAGRYGHLIKELKTLREANSPTAEQLQKGIDTKNRVIDKLFAEAAALKADKDKLQAMLQESDTRYSNWRAEANEKLFEANVEIEALKKSLACYNPCPEKEANDKINKLKAEVDRLNKLLCEQNYKEWSSIGKDLKAAEDELFRLKNQCLGCEYRKTKSTSYKELEAECSDLRAKVRKARQVLDNDKC
jgi:chromosome segregation ATPase